MAIDPARWSTRTASATVLRVAAYLSDARAVTSFSPVCGPSVQTAKARPSASVVSRTAEMEPPPAVTAHVTIAPERTRPVVLTTRTFIVSRSIQPGTPLAGAAVTTLSPPSDGSIIASLQPTRATMAKATISGTIVGS